jgi:hypothetical protein
MFNTALSITETIEATNRMAMNAQARRADG